MRFGTKRRFATFNSVSLALLRASEASIVRFSSEVSLIENNDLCAHCQALVAFLQKCKITNNLTCRMDQEKGGRSEAGQATSTGRRHTTGTSVKRQVRKKLFEAVCITFRGRSFFQFPLTLETSMNTDLTVLEHRIVEAGYAYLAALGELTAALDAGQNSPLGDLNQAYDHWKGLTQEWAKSAEN